MVSTFPAAFIERMSAQLGEQFPAWQEAMFQSPPLSIRLNPRKLPPSPTLVPVPWSQHGFYLPQRPIFALDPAWHGGGYYVQEASSMLLEAVLAPHLPSRPLVVLDLCAAPGGKTTHLASLIHVQSLLLANEVIRQRSRTLIENVSKWGSGNVLVTQQDPRDFSRLPAFFDLILVDAPCSGEGLFRKDPDAIAEWSPEHVQFCAARQSRILEDIWPSLRPGGLLLYSTCTWSPEENEQQILRLLATQDAEVLESPLDPVWGFTNVALGSGSSYQALPHHVAGEGFFLTLLRKSGDVAQVQSAGALRKLELATKKDRAWVSNWLPEDWALLRRGESLYALPETTLTAADHIAQRLPLLHTGVTLAEVKGKDLRPSAGAAWWPDLGEGSWEVLELDHVEALRYLRRDPQSMPTPKGWLLVKAAGMPLGWAKGLGNRLNNYYPQPWRLRMELPSAQ